jgi:hypothetical protein
VAWIERFTPERADPGASSAIGSAHRGRRSQSEPRRKRCSTSSGSTFLVRFATSRDPKNRAPRKFTLCREQQRVFGTRGVQPPSACDTQRITGGFDRWQREFVLTSKSLDARQRDSHDNDDRVRDS